MTKTVEFKYDVGDELYFFEDRCGEIFFSKGELVELGDENSIFIIETPTGFEELDERFLAKTIIEIKYKAALWFAELYFNSLQEIEGWDEDV